ncbi:MAG: S-layer protein [Methanoregulaceae archaeon]|jgi:hypothetical protein|nr:S-layer protein [Methanoregulaceae archaeon]
MTTKGIPGRILFFLVICALIPGITTVAGSTYLSGMPDLVAAIDGTNDFSPGSEQSIVIHVRNTGIDEVKIVQPGGGASGDPPSTARMVTLTLLPGDAPVEIKTDTQMVGDIASGRTVSSPFSVHVLEDAHGGTYHLPLLVNYTYLVSEALVDSGSVAFQYATESVQLDIPLNVKDEVIIAVDEISAGDLNAGGDGYITLTLENAGTLTGTNTIARIFQGDGSPIVPLDGRVFIGDFPPGAVATARFKVAVDEKAGPAQYPLVVAVEYRDRSNATRLSPEVTIGIPVVGKTRFSVTETPAWIYRGATKIIEVEYENTGPTTAYSAQARISAVDPFAASDATSFLGDLAPGEKAVARFEIGVDKTATVKEYGLDTEIRFRDSLDANRISDPMSVRIEVRERNGLSRVLHDPVLMSIIIAVIIGCGYYLFIHRKKMQQAREE